MANMQPFRVVIDARITSGDFGGVEQVIIGLAKGLSSLPISDEEYIFLAYADADDWLRPHIGGASSIVRHGRVAGRRLRRKVRAAIPSIARAWDNARSRFGSEDVTLDRSDGMVEKLGGRVVHFPTQRAFLTDIPSVYHPHDLQHVHYPELFTPWMRRYREVSYRAFCEQAKIVAVSSEWVRQDLIRHFGFPAQKVRVIRLAPPVEGYADPDPEKLHALAKRYGLPRDFALYAAQTWPHKNHSGLLDALAALKRERGIVIPLVCTGKLNEYYPFIRQKVRMLGLETQVRFLGYIESEQLFGLYRMSRMVVIPTTFEAGSFPMWEAFYAKTPVASSNVTSLPEQAGGAALLFDPMNVAEMADVIARVWQDVALRNQLVARGQERLQQISWGRTAQAFRACYREIGGLTHPRTGMPSLDETTCRPHDRA